MKFTQNLKLILCLIPFIGLPSYAVNWVQIDNFDYDYVDIDSISEFSLPGYKNIHSIWVKSYNDGSSFFKPNESYMQAKYLINCNNKESAIKAGNFYDSHGNYLQGANIDNNDLQWASFIPESKIHMIYEHACKPTKSYNLEEQKIGSTPTRSIDIYNNHVDSMVYISTQSSQGSGVIIKEDGTLITCFHVIADADYITEKLNDGTTYKVNGFKYINPLADVAILTLDAPYKTFKPIAINSQPLQIGSKVYTISNPQGLQFSFSDGMINQYNDGYIQFSAPISQGSSGGALLNDKGELLGIITSLLKESQNINFALPNKYYQAAINNQTIFNTYNKKWTEFLVENANESQFKLITEYALKEENYTLLYKYLKPFANRSDFPPNLYASMGLYAFYVFLINDDVTAGNDAIKFYEKSISYNINVKPSILALTLLYGLAQDQQKVEFYITQAAKYPDLDVKITEFIDMTDKCPSEAKSTCVYEQILKLLEYIGSITE